MVHGATNDSSDASASAVGDKGDPPSSEADDAMGDDMDETLEMDERVEGDVGAGSGPVKGGHTSSSAASAGKAPSSKARRTMLDRNTGDVSYKNGALSIRAARRSGVRNSGGAAEAAEAAAWVAPDGAKES